MKKLILFIATILFVSILSAQTIAVRNFESDSFWLGRKTDVMSDLLVDELVRIDGITVVERERVSAILGEKEFQNKGYTDPESVIEQGKMLNADCIIYGNTEFLGDDLFITARLASVLTGQIMYTAKMQCSSWDDFYQKLPKFAQEIVNKIPSPNRFLGTWHCDIDDISYDVTFKDKQKCEVIVNSDDSEITLNGNYSYAKDSYSSGTILKVNASAKGVKTKVSWSSFCTFTSEDYTSFNLQIKNSNGKTVRGEFIKIE